MLKTILGRAGFGKTCRIYDEIAAAVETGGYSKILLIVPEQFSFESERALYARLGAKASMAVEVLSFTRLADNVFRQYGGMAGNYIDDGGRRMLMSLALSELRGSLAIYKKHYANPAFVNNMIATVTEFKYAGIMPEELLPLCDKLSNTTLKNKLTELSTIYECYEALLHRSFSDPIDNLTRANKLLAEHDFFSGSAVFIDEFKGFTGVEFETLSYILRDASLCAAAFCTDTLSDEQGELTQFSPVISTALKLIRIAKAQNTQVLSPVILEKPYRFLNAELVALEGGIFAAEPKIYRDKPSSISVAQAGDIYDELGFVASSIKKLVAEQDMRYRDIVVIGRDILTYRTAMESVFSAFDIPYFYDFKDSIEKSAVMSFTLAALTAAAGSFDSDMIIALCKTGLVSCTLPQAAALQNYIFTWDVKGRMWLSEFKNNPRGFAEDMTPEDEALLGEINALRAELILPLKKLADSIKSADGDTFAKAVYAYLCDMKIPEAVSGKMQEFSAADDHNKAKSLERVWGILVDILDQMAVVLKGAALGGKRLAELFALVAGTYDMGSIPQTLDQVLIGNADRVRPASPKAVFIVGANEGVFPAAPRSGTLLSDSEREALHTAGLELSSTRKQKILEERYIAYDAITGASQLVCVSYPTTAIDGTALYPSVLVSEIKRIFSGLEVTQTAGRDKSELVWNEKTALTVLSQSLRQDTALTATLLKYLGELPTMQAGLASLIKAAEPVHFAIDDKTVARALFGDNITLSPTTVETYYKCGFSHFLKSGIRLKKPQPAKLSPMEAGTLIHRALQLIISKYTVQELAELTNEKLRSEVDIILDDYLLSRLGGKEDKPARFKYLYTRTGTTIVKLLERLIEEFKQSEFTPAEFEFELKRDGEGKPMQLVTPTGLHINVIGSVDRVDIMTKGGKRYLRVVDYKSGKKEFNLSDVYYGLNLQMLLYLFAVCDKGKYEGAATAGVLYMPAKNPVLNLDRSADGEAVKSAAQKELKMNGIILDDPNVLTGMEKDGAGVFIPAKYEIDEGEIKLDKAASVATAAELGKIKRHIEKLVSDMAESLVSGEIDALPAKGRDYQPCAYCEFAGVCGHEQGDPEREIAIEKDSAQVIRRMEAADI